MTDLLMRLAERTLGTPSIARPVIASMFEPVPTLGSSLSISLSAFPEVKEVLETDAPAQRAHVPHAPIIMPALTVQKHFDAIERTHVPQTPIMMPTTMSTDQQPPVSTNSTAAMGNDQQATDTTMPAAARINIEGTSAQASITRRQTKNGRAPGTGIRQDEIVSSLVEPSGFEIQEKETISATPEEPSLGRHSLNRSIVPDHTAEPFTAKASVENEQGALPVVAQSNNQTFALEVPERPEAPELVKRKQVGDIFSTVHVQEQTHQESRPTSSLSQKLGLEIIPEQHMNPEVNAQGALPAVPSQQEGRHSREGSIAQETGHTPLFNEEKASPVDQLTLGAVHNVTQSTELVAANQQVEGGIVHHSARQSFSQQNEQFVPMPSVFEKVGPGAGEAKAEAPTIRVTIGRIDVRAVTSSAPPTRAKPTRAGPTVSLEEYTRQNRRGP